MYQNLLQELDEARSSVGTPDETSRHPVIEDVAPISMLPLPSSYRMAELHRQLERYVQQLDA